MVIMNQNSDGNRWRAYELVFFYHFGLKYNQLIFDFARALVVNGNSPFCLVNQAAVKSSQIVQCL
jgi:hypothetical protein